MDINEVFPSRWMKAQDLHNRQLTVEIERVDLEDIGDETKPVAYFVGHDKGVVLNKTNSLSIADITGSTDTDQWVGHKITLFSMMVAYQGKTQPAIRIMGPPQEQPKPVNKPVVHQQARPAAKPQPKRPASETEAADAAADEAVPF